jgi:hypothetical protein
MEANATTTSSAPGHVIIVMTQFQNKSTSDKSK